MLAIALWCTASKMVRHVAMVAVLALHLGHPEREPIDEASRGLTYRAVHILYGRN